MFGRSRKVEATPGEGWEEELGARTAAQKAWEARRAAAVAAVELPRCRHRIRRGVENDEGGGAQDVWWCEQAYAYAPNIPFGHDEELHGPRFIEGAPTSFWYSRMPYPVATYDQDEPKATLQWTTIGPQRVRKTSYVSLQTGHPGYERAPFYTFEEAARWLRAYLRPVAGEVYFGPDGEPVVREAK